MMKTLFLLMLGLSLYAQPFFETFSFQTNIKDVDLKTYNQSDGKEFGLDGGFIFERDDVYDGEKVKRVLKFNDKGNLDMFFFYKKENVFKNDIKISTPSKFGKAILAFNQDEKHYNLNQEKEFEKDLNMLELKLYEGENGLRILTTYVVLEGKNPSFGITKMKQCINKIKHKECGTCEYIEGHDNDLECVTNTLYHKLF